MPSGTHMGSLRFLSVVSRRDPAGVTGKNNRVGPLWFPHESRMVPAWDPFGILLGYIGYCNIGRVLHRVAQLGPFLRCGPLQSINQLINQSCNEPYLVISPALLAHAPLN